MFKVENGAHPHLKTIPLGVTQVNTLLGIPFEKFWLMFSLNNLKVHHKQNMLINISILCWEQWQL